MLEEFARTVSDIKNAGEKLDSQLKALSEVTQCHQLPFEDAEEKEEDEGEGQFHETAGIGKSSPEAWELDPPPKQCYGDELSIINQYARIVSARSNKTEGPSTKEQQTSPNNDLGVNTWAAEDEQKGVSHLLFLPQFVRNEDVDKDVSSFKQLIKNINQPTQDEDEDEGEGEEAGKNELTVSLVSRKKKRILMFFLSSSRQTARVVDRKPTQDTSLLPNLFLNSQQMS